MCLLIYIYFWGTLPYGLTIIIPVSPKCRKSERKWNISQSYCSKSCIFVRCDVPHCQYSCKIWLKFTYTVSMKIQIKKYSIYLSIWNLGDSWFRKHMNVRLCCVENKNDLSFFLSFLHLFGQNTCPAGRLCEQQGEGGWEVSTVWPPLFKCNPCYWTLYEASLSLLY